MTKPKRLPATKKNVDEIRLNVIKGDRDMTDLKKCGCPACMVAHGQLVETKGVRMIDVAIKAYEERQDSLLIENLYYLRNMLLGVEE